jgi:hypothetical protein
MKLAVSSRQQAVFGRYVALVCLLLTAYCSLGCGSIPNLESPECTAARSDLRRFYSFHFDSDMTPTKESLAARKGFLTASFSLDVEKGFREDPLIDPFTGTSPPPSTFKLGKCVSKQDEAGFVVQFYWRSDSSTVQHETEVNMKRIGDKWYLDHIGKLN